MFRFCAWRHLDKLLGPRWALRCRWFFQLLHKSRNSRHCDAIVNIYHILPRYSWQSVTTRLKVWRCDVLCCQCVCDIKPAITKPALEQYLLLCSDQGAIFYSIYEVKAILQKVISWVPKRSNRIPKFCVMSHNERVLCSIFCSRTHSWEAPKASIINLMVVLLLIWYIFFAVLLNQYLKPIKALLPLFFLTWWKSGPNIGRCLKWLHELCRTEAFQLRKLTLQ